MAVNGISIANGADLLQKLMESSGQAPAAAPLQNTTASMKTAVTEAQLSEASMVAGAAPDTTGTLLNTYA